MKLTTVNSKKNWTILELQYLSLVWKNILIERFVKDNTLRSTKKFGFAADEPALFHQDISASGLP